MAARWRVPSQAYTFLLVSQAIQRKALIICMRGARYWLGALPALADYDRYCVISNPRSSSISVRNLPAFRKVVDALRG